jgi:hypothetical protein
MPENQTLFSGGPKISNPDERGINGHCRGDVQGHVVFLFSVFIPFTRCVSTPDVFTLRYQPNNYHNIISENQTLFSGGPILAQMG